MYMTSLQLEHLENLGKAEPPQMRQENFELLLHYVPESEQHT